MKLNPRHRGLNHFQHLGALRVMSHRNEEKKIPPPRESIARATDPPGKALVELHSRLIFHGEAGRSGPAKPSASVHVDCGREGPHNLKRTYVFTISDSLRHKMPEAAVDLAFDSPRHGRAVHRPPPKGHSTDSGLLQEALALAALEPPRCTSLAMSPLQTLDGRAGKLSICF